jgi:YhhN family
VDDLSVWRRRWVMGLVAVWAVLLFGGLALGGGGDVTERMPEWTRMASSLTLVGLGWSWFGFGRGGPTARFAGLLAAGMTLGFIGDLVLSGLLPGGEHVLAGIAAFGLGHVLYITAGIGWGDRHGVADPRARRTALAVWLVVGAVAWYVVVFRGQDATVLHWAALGYALLLAATAGVATGLAVQCRLFVPFAVGAALFLASDLILAAQLFNDVSFAHIGDIIWLTYGPGQMLIVNAVFAARLQLRR